MIRITTLMENHPSEHKALKAEHGLSFLVEAGGKRFLFDCGSGEDTLYNAHRLGIDLTAVDFTVCSHSHYDHAAGFRDMVEQGAGGRQLYTGPGFWDKKYAFDGVKYTDLSAGYDADFLATHGIEQRVCDGLLPLVEGCWLVGNFARRTTFETIPPRFVKGVIPHTVADDFSDEICLAMQTSRGLVVLVGCSHPGILNMIRTVHEVLQQPVYAVFGGTHLVEADEARIEATVKELQNLGMSVLGLCHCSGALAEEWLTCHSPLQACHMAVGDCIALE